MPGIATQFEVLRLTLDKLDAAGDPDGLAADMKQHLDYAHMGALGPLIGDFLPSDPHPPDVIPMDYPVMWKMLFHLVGKEQSPTGLYHVLADLEDLLAEIEPLANAEDCDGLKDLADAGLEDRISETTAAFATVLGSIQQGALEIAGIIGTGLRPKVTTDNPADPVPPSTDWAMRDFLHWKRTGEFVHALLDKAAGTGDARLRAYALGFAVGYSGHTCGNGFVNSIVGGPSRTQWWRQRFVRNYVDAWVYGYCQQDPRPVVGDVPVPPFTDPAWADLCNANLQARIAVQAHDPVSLMDLAARNQPFPDVIDNVFATHWFEALDAVYGDELPAGVSGASFNSAYTFTWLTLWFQTSGEVMGCKRSLPAEPPDGCGESPSELDPFVNGVPIDGVVPTPPDASIDYDVDEAAIICGIILAIIGGLLFLGGGVVAGGIAIGAAVAVLDCDNVVDLDYKKLRCLLYWQRMFLHNALEGVHRLLALAALEYPYAEELAIDSDFQDLFPFLDPWESGRQLCRSKVDIGFPGIAWDGSLLTFNRPPTNFESPRTTAYHTAAYPDFFVEGAANPVTPDTDVKTGVPEFAADDGGFFRAIHGELPVQFGNAVDNAVDLLTNLGDTPPDWNLDQDRGLAYLTWQFKGGYDSGKVEIEPEA